MNNKKEYEIRDIPVKPVAIGGIVFMIIVGITLFLLYEYYIRVLDDTEYELKLSKRSKKLMELRKLEDESLNSYKIIDEEKQIYQIPIDRSKKLMLDEQSN